MGEETIHRSAREIPSTSLRAGSSLLLKGGSAQDDAVETHALARFFPFHPYA